MRWIAPSEKDAASATLEKRLWDAADQFRANSGLKAQEYSGPILGLIFLRFAEARFAALLALPEVADFDAFGRIYEYFLGEFAMSEGQGGGEFYTPSSIVKLLTEVIEPFHGRILDPASGSGGMFVQSARFVAEHQKNPAAELAICGVEKTDETGRLCRLNLAVHGLEGDIRHGGNVNSYYDNPHAATGTTFKEISRGVFKTIDFLQPPERVVRQFESAVAPLAEQVLSLRRRVQNLRRTRDLLLPRLLSSQIALDELEAA